jgi:hypothetical protein
MEDVADVYKVSLSSNTSACSTCNLDIDTAGADGISFNSELDTLHHVGYPNVHLLRDTKAARRAGYIQNNKVTKDFVQRFFGRNSWMDLWKHHIMLPMIRVLETGNLELAASTLEQIIWKRKFQSDECRLNGRGFCHQHRHMIYQAEICLQAVLNEICTREHLWDETSTVRILSTVNTERLNKMIHYMKVFRAHEARKVLTIDRHRAEKQKEILKRFTREVRLRNMDASNYQNNGTWYEEIFSKRGRKKLIEFTDFDFDFKFMNILMSEGKEQDMEDIQRIQIHYMRNPDQIFGFIKDMEEFVFDLFVSTNLEERRLAEQFLEKIQNYLRTRRLYPMHTESSLFWMQIMAERDKMYQSIYRQFGVQTAGTINYTERR